MPRKKLTASIAILFVAFVCVTAVAGCTSPSTPQGQQLGTPSPLSSTAPAPSPQAAVKGGNLVGTWGVSMGTATGPTWQFLGGGKLTETLPVMKGGTQTLQGDYQLNGDSMTVSTQGKGGTTIVGKVTWVSADQFQFVLGGGTLTFTRKK